MNNNLWKGLLNKGKRCLILVNGWAIRLHVLFIHSVLSLLSLTQTFNAFIAAITSGNMRKARSFRSISIIKIQASSCAWLVTWTFITSFVLEKRPGLLHQCSMYLLTRTVRCVDKPQDWREIVHLHSYNDRQCSRVCACACKSLSHFSNSWSHT